MPYIKPSFIEQLEGRIDIVQIIQDFVKLKKSGSVFVGLSPFGAEKTRSFTVSPGKEIYKDFSSGRGGNAINFLMELKGWSYPEAIEYIAEKLRMTVEYDDSEHSKELQLRNEKKASLSSVMQMAITKYHQIFKALPPDHPAKEEVYGHRGYTDEMVDHWEIGFAPGNKTLYKILYEKALLIPAEEIGLVKSGNDRFWNRVIYPIYDAKNKAIGIAGRNLDAEKKTAKWINPDDSPLYNKSQVLYGFNEAREHIYQSHSAYVVEGYNDVIAWHSNGIQNTVSASGTSFTLDQMRMLRKVASKIILTFDGDGAGKKAMVKYIPELLSLGFRVEVLDLLGCDPDDFTRLYKDSIRLYPLPKMLSEKDMTRDAFGVLIDQLPEDPIDRAQEAKKLAEVIALIEDEAMAEIYGAWLSTKTAFTKTKIAKWIKEARNIPEPEPTRTKTEHEVYILPNQVKTPLSDLIYTIEKYQLFQANNQIYMMANDEPPYFFQSVSNFSIEIVQHMADEKFPMKLIRIHNVHGEEKIFDIPSSEINTPQSFDKAMTDQGNFFFKGGRNELQKLRSYLYDQMGTGRRIDVLGWQPEGFWCWNNKAVLEDGTSVDMCENGILKIKNVSYYVPSANKIYANNVFKYDAQKKVAVYPSPITFQTYTAKMKEVHGDHAITGLLFTIATMFQDIVVQEIGNFPIMFLYGPASSGKDQLMECCQSFFGIPQTAINLEGGVSTIKAQVREFAQFSNLMSHLSEYKRGDPKLDGVLKGLWDRRGYKRGNIESHVGTESIPILSSVGMTGNDYPDNEALITRQMVEEMTRTTFTDEEVKKFEDLSDMTKQGISSLTDELLRHRLRVKAEFKKKFRMFKSGFAETVPEAKSRMISNLSVLGAFYHIFKDSVNFPFDQQAMLDHFNKITAAQMRKLNSASIITRWWDCFLASMRGPITDRLQVKRDFKIENEILYFNFTNAYNKIQRQWFTQYRENAPGKTSITDPLRKDRCFIEDLSSTRIGETNTSAMLINLEHVSLKEELTNAMEWQLNEKTLFATPATPAEETDNGEVKTEKTTKPGKKDDELPF